MPLERLQLTNFRGFESLDLSFEPDLTVLVGVNGCGKTSVLDVLAIGFGLRTSKPQDVRTNADKATIMMQVDGIDHGIRIPGPALHHPSDLPETLALFYTVNRAVTDQTPGTTRPRAWGKEDARMKGGSDPYSELFSWIREAEDAENEKVRFEKGSEDPQLRAVRHAVKRLMPGHTNLRVRRRGAMGDSRPRLTIEKDGEALLFDSLSEGERTLIAMIADIARRLAIYYPEADDPLVQPCLLVIDEFEQHLHPQWQREFPLRLREVFPGAQMILTTHSPIVVSELLPQHLRAIKDFRLLEGAHREGQDVNEILEALFGTPSRNVRTQKLIAAIHEAIDEDRLDDAATKLEALAAQLGSDDPEVVRLTTIHRMLGAIDDDAVSQG
ncbi:AAA family ATPase [Paraliomyxa miuraensis]|uniref:AAA family ATPase n=1 Tax=Paraliomyxa miuraensis TaxID=376150 RepID=UPI0022512CBF|nr:AAA family ATPase [Paraliomyxa miuraensis]MCX4243728.1 AAA family ATPase [Paraliomyxa miuraensis]